MCLCWHKVKNVFHKSVWKKPTQILLYEGRVHNIPATKHEYYDMCACNSSNQSRVHPWFCLWIAFISLLKHATTKKKRGKGKTWKRLKKGIFIQILKTKKGKEKQRKVICGKQWCLFLWYDSDTFEWKWSLLHFLKQKQILN